MLRSMASEEDCFLEVYAETGAEVTVLSEATSPENVRYCLIQVGEHTGFIKRKYIVFVVASNWTYAAPA